MNMLKSDDSIFILAQSHSKTLKVKIIDGQILLEEINKTHIFFSQKNTVSKVKKMVKYQKKFDVHLSQ